MSDLSIVRFVAHQGHVKLHDLVDQGLPEANGQYEFSFLLRRVSIPELRYPWRPEMLELLTWVLRMEPGSCRRAMQSQLLGFYILSPLCLVVLSHNQC